jgi:hypothetical protein
VIASQVTAPRRSLRLDAATARCMVPLEATRITVAMAVRTVSSSTFSGGHTSFTDRSVK